MLCGQAKISELFPPHSAFAVSGLVLLKFFFRAFHHRGPESDSWGESVKAYSVLHFSSRTSRFVPRQNVGLRTCPSSPTRCHRVFCVWLHHLVVAPRSDTGNNYPPVVVMTPAGMWWMGGNVESRKSVRSLWGKGEVNVKVGNESLLESPPWTDGEVTGDHECDTRYD